MHDCQTDSSGREKGEGAFCMKGGGYTYVRTFIVVGEMHGKGLMDKNGFSVLLSNNVFILFQAIVFRSTRTVLRPTADPGSRRPFRTCRRTRCPCPWCSRPTLRRPRRRGSPRYSGTPTRGFLSPNPKRLPCPPPWQSAQQARYR